MGMDSPGLRKRFTKGDCWVLACHISLNHPEWIYAETRNLNHAFCVRQKDDGSWEALDIDGVRPLREFLTSWLFIPFWRRSERDLYFYWDTTSRERLNELQDSETRFANSWSVAEEVAPWLIAEANQESVKEQSLPPRLA